MEKYTYRPHRGLLRYNNEMLPGLGKSGSLVERNALLNASIDEENPLEEEQLQEIEDNDYWTLLYDKTLPETANGITQEDIITSLEHGKLPGGFTFEDFVEYIHQEDLEKF